MSWEYEKTPLNGGAPGDAFKSIFNGSGKSHAETLAREAIQNSVDAAIEPATSIRVAFRFTCVEGTDRTRFEDAARMQDMRGRESGLGLFRDNALVQQDRPLVLLYIDDFHTTGLVGDPTSPSSNLRKLLMDLGGSGKARQEEVSGGSYGFGKAVYSSTSRIGTIFAFSRTRDGQGNPVSLLMGCAYHEGHKFDGQSWTGRAFYGTSTSIRGAGTRYDPFCGEKAEVLAARLGFARRDADFGTSILIVDAGVEPEDVVSGIEDWWWPRIIAGCLDAIVVTATGDDLSPRPKKHRHLKPFIDAFYCARRQTPPISGQLDRSEFNRIDGRQVGTMGLVVVDDSEEENPFGDAYEERLDTVAIVRSPLMVVDYHRKWRPNIVGPVVVGCFVADAEIDYELKLSEPPDHSRWDPDADRLLKYSERAQGIVDSVLKRIRTNYKRFQAAAKPPAPPRPKRLERLERALASWFGVGPKGGNPQPDPNPAPISLIPDDIDLSLENGNLRARGGVKIKLADSNGPGQRFRVRLELQVAEEEGVSAKDPIPVEVRSEAPIERQIDGYWLGQVERDEVVRIEFTSAPYDPEWTIRFLPEVLPVETAEEVAA